MSPIGRIAKDVLIIHYFSEWCFGGRSFMVAPDGKEEGKLGDGLYGIGADDFTFAGIAAENAVSACDGTADHRRARRMAVSRLVK